MKNNPSRSLGRMGYAFLVLGGLLAIGIGGVKAFAEEDCKGKIQLGDCLIDDKTGNEAEKEDKSVEARDPGKSGMTEGALEKALAESEARKVEEERLDAEAAEEQRKADELAKLEEEYKTSDTNTEGTEEDLFGTDAMNKPDPTGTMATDVDEANAEQANKEANKFLQDNPMSYPEGQGECGELMSSCATQMVGYKTSTIPGTNGGKLGCAAGVSMIIQCAAKKDPKFAIKPPMELSTNGLFKKLEQNSAYEKKMQGANPPSAGELKPGDILVTQRGSKAGHTGVYVGNGQIVHNSSNRGYLVRQSYSMWGSVTRRNPSQSAVFRPGC